MIYNRDGVKREDGENVCVSIYAGLLALSKTNLTHLSSPLSFSKTVATDYNAGFTSALAGMLHLVKTHQLPK